MLALKIWIVIIIQRVLALKIWIIIIIKRVLALKIWIIIIIKRVLASEIWIIMIILRVLVLTIWIIIIYKECLPLLLGSSVCLGFLDIPTHNLQSLIRIMLSQSSCSTFKIFDRFSAEETISLSLP